MSMVTLYREHYGNMFQVISLPVSAVDQISECGLLAEMARPVGGQELHLQIPLVSSREISVF